MRIAVVYTVEEKNNNRPQNQHGLLQLNDTNQNIYSALISLGHKVHMLPADYNMLENLKKIKPDCIFNNCTGIHDKSSQPQIAGLLELSGFPFTGSSQLTHNLALYKPLAKLLLQSLNIPTPKFQVIKHVSDVLNPNLKFPLIVKPEHEGSSMGITNDSVVNNESECLSKARYILTNYQQPALIEEFVVGREFTVGVLGNSKPQILPYVEIGFGEGNGFYSHQVKSKDGIKTICPADVNEALQKKINEAVLGAYKALNCFDYSRIDVRLTKNNEPRIIEVNTLPGLQKGYSDFPKAALVAGITYENMIDIIINSAINRFKK